MIDKEEMGIIEEWIENKIDYKEFKRKIYAIKNRENPQAGWFEILIWICAILITILITILAVILLIF